MFFIQVEDDLTEIELLVHDGISRDDGLALPRLVPKKQKQKCPMPSKKKHIHPYFLKGLV